MPHDLQWKSFFCCLFHLFRVRTNYSRIHEEAISELFINAPIKPRDPLLLTSKKPSILASLLEIARKGAERRRSKRTASIAATARERAFWNG